MVKLVARTPAKDSMLYRRFGDGRAILFGPHALMLQVMHPVVSAGVVQHSVFREQAWRRLHETVLSTATWAYGGDEGTALEARRLRALHTSIAGVMSDGSRYTSLAPSPWTWVFATLVKGSVDAQQYFGRPIPPGDLYLLYTQARELGLLLGIREQDLPDNWEEFLVYFDDMVDNQLERTEAADQVLDFLRHVTRPKPLRFVIPNVVWRALIWPLSYLSLTVTTATLPPVLVERLGLTMSPMQRGVLAVFRTMVRTGYALTPPRLRYAPAVVLGRVNTRRLRKQAAKADAITDLKANGEWDEAHPWTFAPPLKRLNETEA